MPHTRPVGTTRFASDPSVLGDYTPIFGQVKVPSSADALLHLRLAEAGLLTLGVAVHVPHYLAESQFGDAAVAAADVIMDLTGLVLPTADLVAMAGLTRGQIEAELARNPEAREVVQGMEQRYDHFVEGQKRRSLLAAEASKLPSADEIGAQLEAFLRNPGMGEELGGPDGDGADAHDGSDGGALPGAQGPTRGRPTVRTAAAGRNGDRAGARGRSPAPARRARSTPAPAAGHRRTGPRSGKAAAHPLTPGRPGPEGAPRGWGCRAADPGRPCASVPRGGVGRGPGGGPLLRVQRVGRGVRAGGAGGGSIGRRPASQASTPVTRASGSSTRPSVVPLRPRRPVGTVPGP
ncbi:PAC2 family protein [Ornithinimicrobium flavum]|uniref:PAC2 family protein n=1 Tax=Ornithinimicrobium flavum TaxID=1288636 RepID=UPI001EE92561|nr:PAC2 family protein [Ornithinimicrobium flavum]